MTGGWGRMVWMPTLTNEAIGRKAQFSVADVANTIRKVGWNSSSF
jgi:hypothetical protein